VIGNIRRPRLIARPGVWLEGEVVVLMRARRVVLIVSGRNSTWSSPSRCLPLQVKEPLVGGRAETVVTTLPPDVGM